MNSKDNSDYQNSPYMASPKVDSSLKQRMKPIIRSSASPTGIFNLSSSDNSQNLEQSNLVLPKSLDDIDACMDKLLLEKMYYHLKSGITVNEEKIRKMELVKNYNLKNKPDEFLSLINKWRIASQEALMTLHLKAPGNEDFPSLLKKLNINPDTIHYDLENGFSN